MTLRAIVVASAVLSLAGCAPADPAAPPLDARDPAALIEEWSRLNSACRGGSGDAPATDAACQARGAVDAKLEAAGWCYGRPGEAGYQNDWHPRSEGCTGDPASVAAPVLEDVSWYIVDWRDDHCLLLRDQLDAETPEEAAAALSTPDRPQSVRYGAHGVTALIGDPPRSTMALALGLANCHAASKVLAAAG